MFIVVGVTGGIAAYKVVQLVRDLVLAGHDVHVVPTVDSLRFVGLATWEAISRNPVTTSVHDDVAQVRHVALGQQADLVIVAPATANRMGKLVAGIADDLLGTTLLATKAPVVIAPAMHTEMWEHPATQANAATLRSRGVHFIGPDSGQLTGQDSGPGRMAEPARILREALEVVADSGDLSGLSVAVSTGGTREAIDPVRFIGNRSSGRQGVAVAMAAAHRGARVRLVAANVSDAVLADAHRHPAVEIIEVVSTAELKEAMEAAAPASDVLVMVAAVADFRPLGASDTKLSKQGDSGMVLEMEQNPDILAGLVRHSREDQTVVGFAAETAEDRIELLTKGRAKRRRKGVDLLAVNEVGWDKGFEAGRNTLVILDSDDEVIAEATGTKDEVADVLWDAVRDTRGR